MQLFITKFTEKNNLINIIEERIYEQTSKVLKFKKGEIFYIQNEGKRIKCSFEYFQERTVIGKEISTENNNNEIQKNKIYIAFPNKRDKVELITQKLTEIGITEIVFFPSEKSIIKDTPSSAKIERLKKIILEASEQSRSWNIPEIRFSTSEELKNIKNISIFHQTGKNTSPGSIGLIGPEGGFSEKELNEFSGEKISLGNSILRMETAAIIGGRLMKNSDRLN